MRVKPTARHGLSHPTAWQYYPTFPGNNNPMSVFNLDRTLITKVAPTKTAAIRDGQIVVRNSKKNPQTQQWEDAPIIAKDEPFGMDVWSIQVGHEVWSEGANGKRSREA